MNGRCKLAALLMAAGPVASCITPAGSGLAWLTLGGSGPCSVSIGERRFDLPEAEAALEVELRRLAKNRAGAIVAGEPGGLSYSCYREAMTIINRARFNRLGFVSDLEAETTPAR